MTPRTAFKGIRKRKKTLLFITLGALWGPGGTTRVCPREVDFGLRFAPPRTSQKSGKSGVWTTFSGKFSDPVRHQIRGGFCRLPINVRSRKA